MDVGVSVYHCELPAIVFVARSISINFGKVKYTPDEDFNVDETMWHSKQFCSFLQNERQYNRNGRKITWTGIQQQMKKLVWISLQACKDRVVDRPNSFELFGYDFMVDTYGVVWIIECNSSPDLSFSTATTKALVSKMMPELANVSRLFHECSVSKCDIVWGVALTILESGRSVLLYIHTNYGR